MGWVRERERERESMKENRTSWSRGAQGEESVGRSGEMIE